MSNQNINIYQLKEILKSNADLPLIFSFDGQNIHPGYHVTEVQHAQINALDCGSGKDEWEEIVVQLMDGSSLYNGEHMSCGKFIGIVGKAIESLSFDEDSLTFIEFAPNNDGLRKLTIDSAENGDRHVILKLSSPTATCKPYLRTMTNPLNKASRESCCN